MALTKVKLISDGIIVQSNLHSSHGITTAHIGEGSNLYYTDARARAAVSENSTQLSYNSSTGVLTYTQGDTDTVSEGSSNLYYTNARADARITNALVDEDNMASNSAVKLPSQQSVKAYVDTEVAGIVSSAPSTLDTLNELAAALGDDANFSTTVTNNIATKLPLAGGTMTGDITASQSVFNITNNDIRFKTSGAETMLRAVANDAVELMYNNSTKIETTSTGVAVTGTARIAANASYYSDRTYLGDTWEFASDTTDGVTFKITGGASNTSGNFFKFQTQAGGATAGTKLIIDKSGNVGIGTDSPSDYYADKLVVKCDSSENGITIVSNANTDANYIMFADGSSGDDRYRGQIAYNHQTNFMAFAVNASNKMYILDSGRIGIGTDSPGKNVEIKGAASAYTTLRITSGSTSHGAEIEFGDSGDVDYGSITQFATSAGEGGRMRFRAGGTETMNLRGGNVIIGDTTGTSPNSADRFLKIGKSDLQDCGIILQDAVETWEIYQNDDLQFSFGTTPTTVMTMQRTTGNVGIGTTSPDAKLSVGPEDTTNELRFLVDNDATGVLGVYNDDQASNYNQTDNGYVLQVGTRGGSPGFKSIEARGNCAFATQTGNVKIGSSTTGTPAANADDLFIDKGAVESGISIISTTAASLRFGDAADTSVGSIEYNHTSNYMRFIVNAGEKMRIDTSGNVGIGGAPSHTLDVKGADTNNATIARFYSNTGTRGSFVINNGTGVTPTTFIGTAGGSEQLSIGTNSTEAIRIDGSQNATFAGDVVATNFETGGTGYLYLGGHVRLNNPGSGAFKLGQYNGSSWTDTLNITNDGTLLIGCTSEGNTNAYFSLESNDRSVLALGTSTTSTSTVAVFRNPNGGVGSVSVSGSATAYNTSSDYRLKEDLQDFNGLDKVSKISVYDFKWKSEDKRSYGVMAHELEEVLPQAVSGEKDAEEMQGVDYSKIVPLLVKSIQELKAEIETLKTQINK